MKTNTSAAGTGGTPTHIALVRAINVGGRNRVAMADLRALFADLGFESVRTLLQSGNAVFRSRARASGKLERVLEDGAAATLDLRTDFFVRSAKEWHAIVEHNPFEREAKEDPSRLAFVCLKARAPDGAGTVLQAMVRGSERIQVRGQHAYIVYPDGIGRSSLTSATIEKALGSRATARNWNTVLKLEAMLDA